MFIHFLKKLIKINAIGIVDYGTSVDVIVRHAEHIGADILMYELLTLVNLDADTAYGAIDEMDVPASEAYERRVGRGEMQIHNPLNKVEKPEQTGTVRRSRLGHF